MCRRERTKTVNVTEVGVCEQKVVDMSLSPERELISEMPCCFDENIGSFITANSQRDRIVVFG